MAARPVPGGLLKSKPTRADPFVGPPASAFSLRGSVLCGIRHGSNQAPGGCGTHRKGGSAHGAGDAVQEQVLGGCVRRGGLPGLRRGVRWKARLEYPPGPRCRGRAKRHRCGGLLRSQAVFRRLPSLMQLPWVHPDRKGDLHHRPQRPEPEGGRHRRAREMPRRF
jgi:hypothetical protein